MPGTYRVRFTLQGWKPYQREGVELAGSFTAVVNAELAVGSMNETITVIGETPAIDVHRAGREITLSGDLVQSIPTARSYNALLSLIPGVLTNANDTVTGTAATSFPIHGGRTNEGRLSLDGMTVGSPPSGNSATSYVIDVAQSQEVTFVTAGGLGESETAGLTMNIVPKSGGNALHGSFFVSGTGREVSVQQSDTRVNRSRRHGADAVEEGLRRIGNDWRSDSDRSVVVFRKWPYRRQHERQRQRLLQPERRRSQSVAVRARRQPQSSTPTELSRTRAAASPGR